MWRWVAARPAGRRPRTSCSWWTTARATRREEVAARHGVRRGQGAEAGRAQRRAQHRPGRDHGAAGGVRGRRRAGAAGLARGPGRRAPPATPTPTRSEAPSPRCWRAPRRARAGGRSRRSPPSTSATRTPRPEMVWGANFAVRRAAVQRLGRFDPALSGHGDEEDWLMALRATSGEIYYLADAGLEHRRTGEDSRLRALARAAWHRGRAARRTDRRRGNAPACRHGAAQRGRRRLAHRAPPLPPGADHGSALGRAAGRGAARPVSAAAGHGRLPLGRVGLGGRPAPAGHAHAGRRRARARRPGHARGPAARPPGRPAGAAAGAGARGVPAWLATAPKPSRGCAPSATTCAWRWAPPPIGRILRWRARRC